MDYHNYYPQQSAKLETIVICISQIELKPQRLSNLFEMTSKFELTSKENWDLNLSILTSVSMYITSSLQHFLMSLLQDL